MKKETKKFIKLCVKRSGVDKVLWIGQTVIYASSNQSLDVLDIPSLTVNSKKQQIKKVPKWLVGHSSYGQLCDCLCEIFKMKNGILMETSETQNIFTKF